MMLPPLKSLPREGLTFFIASEPYLTANKHLIEAKPQRRMPQNIFTHERALIRMDSMNSFESMSVKNLPEAQPAWGTHT